MSKYISFQTDAAAVTGFGAEVTTGLTFFQSERGIALLDMKQATGVAAANDADWVIWANYKSTGIRVNHALTNPVNTGAKRIFSTPLKIRPKAVIQFQWIQAVAQANTVDVEYEEL